MKRLFFVFLVCAVFLCACEKKPEEAPVTVIKIGETTPSPSITATPTIEVTDTPTPAPTDTPTPSPSPSVTNEVVVSPTPTAAAVLQSFLEAVNAMRAEESVSVLSEDETLTMLAGVRLAELKTTGLSHTRPNGQGFESIFSAYGYSVDAVCELVFSHERLSEEKAFSAFSQSKEHRRELMGDYNAVGIAFDGTNFVVLLAKNLINQ